MPALISVDRAHWELVEVSAAVLDRAERLLLETPLRRLDAVHLGSALAIQADAMRRLPFITGQRDAAPRVGLDIVWVG